MTGTWDRVLLRNNQLKFQEEWQTSDMESNWEMISREIKRSFGKTLSK